METLAPGTVQWIYDLGPTAYCAAIDLADAWKQFFVHEDFQRFNA